MMQPFIAAKQDVDDTYVWRAIHESIPILNSKYKTGLMSSTPFHQHES